MSSKKLKDAQVGDRVVIEGRVAAIQGGQVLVQYDQANGKSWSMVNSIPARIYRETEVSE